MAFATYSRPTVLVEYAKTTEVRGTYKGVRFTNANRKAGGFRPDEWRILLSNIWFGSLEALQAEVDRMQAEGDPMIRAGRQEEPF
jgi:hypothetical protein